MEPESYTDGSPTDQNQSNSSSRAQPAEPPEFFNGIDYYDMSKTKHLLVFNHEKYKKKSLFADTLPPRYGTAEDVKSLINVFSDLKFEITVKKDLLREQIFNIIDDFVAQDHSGTSCVVVVIMTHGFSGGELWGADGPYNLSNIMAKFEGGSLVLIPKVFLIQACRGDNKDDGQRIQLDGSGKATFTVPTHGDFLVLYSTIEDYVSYRDSRGSWMIQTFCNILREYHQSLDLLHIITLVNKTIAYDYISYSIDNPSIHHKKQTSETKFTLTKLLKF